VARSTAFGNTDLPDRTVAAEAELVAVWGALAHRPISFATLGATVVRRWRGRRAAAVRP
jgi:hypothetical protein